VVKWLDTLDAVMECDRAETCERYVHGETVLELFHGDGRAKSTGRAFKSGGVRSYTMR
jgi:hypothetical protein